MSSLSPNRVTRLAPQHTGEPLVVGLVNNMPDAALRLTEWQVRDLLARAAGPHPVLLRVFSFPEVPRSETGLDHVRQYHEPIAALWESDVSGLIVTGTEPKAANLTDEPYWPALTRLIDWAEEHTVSTVWSCLASHAAAYKLDGIERRALGRKTFGVFECQKVDDHPLVSGLSHWRVPHSRLNELAEEDLLQAGYRVLSRADGAGVDMFVKQRQSLFVFVQGHPEYDATALFGEYRRGVRRYLAGENENYPELPHGYFADDAANLLLAFRERAEARRDPGLLEHFPAAEVGRQLTAPWRDDAAGIYANWLSYLREHRAERRGWANRPATAETAPRRSPTYA